MFMFLNSILKIILFKVKKMLYYAQHCFCYCLPLNDRDFFSLNHFKNLFCRVQGRCVIPYFKLFAGSGMWHTPSVCGSEIPSHLGLKDVMFCFCPGRNSTEPRPTFSVFFHLALCFHETLPKTGFLLVHLRTSD